MSKLYNCKLIYKKQIAENIFDFRVEAPFADEVKPGHFLHIECGGKTFLRRPISICDAGDGVVRFIFEVKGEGTKELSAKEEGAVISIMGPLGNGFILDKQFKKPAIIGGGIGVFPLFKLAKTLENPSVFLGFRSADRVVMEEEFAEFAKTAVATDDGSYGHSGFAVELLLDMINEQGCDGIFACGPTPMLKTVKQLSEGLKIPCQLSLEQRMGCGIGACLVCSCETIFADSNKYRRVCKDGPVFRSEEVVL